jgi:peptide/nickel transport system substrate-binding protein
MTAVGLFVVLGTVLAACGPATATPAAGVFKAKDPTTLVYATIGDPEMLDPVLDYETGGGEIVQNVYETLAFYNKNLPTDFIPQLATKWDISQDGMTYTFTIRQGVKFHNGDSMTPADVAYSFQRGLLQGGTASPQWLLTQPLLGADFYDIAEVVDPSGALDDDPEGLAKADPAALKAACDKVMAAVVDNGDGTVSFHLAQSWGPFLATIANSWGSITDKAWDIQQGTWDGSCDTWQNFYGKDASNTPLTEKMNGTGPFMFDHWTKGQEVALKANPNYWRTEPAWDGGPTGPAKIQNILIKTVPEWGTRFAMMQAGDADFADVPRANISQIDPLLGEKCPYVAASNTFDCKPTDNTSGPLRLFLGAPTTIRTDVMFNFNINTEGGNSLIGSGKLDGNGIRPDFFSDIHVRLAFEYCFDWETYNNQVLQGEAVQNVGVLIPGMPGYDPNGAKYTFDSDKCKSEIEQAWNGEVAKNGFRLQIAYNTGNTERQTIAQILATDFAAIDPKYQIEILGLPWPTFLQAQRAFRLPVFVSGWLEDIHDPHNWVVPFTTATGAYSRRQSLPAGLYKQFGDLAAQGVGLTDPAARAKVYAQIQQLDYDQAIAIRGSVQTNRHYEQRWVQGYYYNPIYSQFYYYPLSKQ